MHDSLYFSMHLRDVLKYNAYIHAYTVCSFNRTFFVISWINWRQNYVVCSYFLVRLFMMTRSEHCTVSTVTADRSGKFVLLTYSLTASHCSTEAHLVGVPLPRSFDSCLVLRQNCSERLKSLAWCGCKKIHRFCVLIKAFLVKKKGTKTAVLSRVAKWGGQA